MNKFYLFLYLKKFKFFIRNFTNCVQLNINPHGYLQENNTISIKEVHKNCGISIGCLSQCTLDSCSHLITWQKRGEFARFEFLADLNQLNMGLNLYQSIAFSDDKFMVSRKLKTNKPVKTNPFKSILLTVNSNPCFAGKR